MNAEVFAEWLRRQGYDVVRTPSSYWYEVSSRVYQAFPFHWIIDPQEKELRDMLWETGAIALRYSTPVVALEGKISYHVVCEGPSFDLATLPRQARQNVRKGLKHASIEPIPLFRLAAEGWNLRQETLARQGRAGAESDAWWHRLCESAGDLPGFEAWGAIREGKLVASFLAFACDGCYVLPYHQSTADCMPYRINNSLFYTVTREALDRPHISEVFLGLNSLDAPPSVDKFKFRMGYTARPVRQRVVFHTLLTPVVNRISYAALQQLTRWYPGNPALSKAEGMFRFHLEGKRSLTKQDWPECLADAKSAIGYAVGSPVGP